MALKQRRLKASGGARATVDHDEIMSWAEEKGARPVMVRGTGILRLDFPGLSGGDAFEAISWDEFFEKFEQSELAFLYEDTTGTRRNSTFNKLVHRKTGEAHGERRLPRATRAPSPTATSTRSTQKKSSSTRKAGTPARARTGASSRSASSPSQGAAQQRRARPARGAPSRGRTARTSKVRSAPAPARTTAPKQLSRKAPSKKRGRTSAKSRSR